MEQRSRGRLFRVVASGAVLASVVVPSVAAAQTSSATPVTARSGSVAADSAAAGGSWTKTADLPVGLWDHKAVVGDGTLYVVGGTAEGLQEVKTLYSFDPTSESWKKLADMSHERAGATVGWIDGKLYVTGGWGAGKTGVVEETEVYDPATDAWSTGPSMPTPRGGSGSFVAGGKLYVIGGCAGHQCGFDEVQVLDPNKGTWSKGPAYPTPIAVPSCGVVNKVVYCAGGMTDVLYDDSDATYALKGGKWSKRADMPVTSRDSASSVVDGALHVYGGISGDDPEWNVASDKAWSYDPASDTWSDLPESSERHFGAAGACGYRVGGTVGLTDPPSTTVERLPVTESCS